MRKESDCLEHDEAINHFILNRSDDDFPAAEQPSKQSSMVENQNE